MNVQRKVAAEATDDDVARIKADIATLTEDVKTLSATLSNVASSRADEGLQRGKELAGKASAKASETKGDVETSIRNNPLAAVGVALGVGAILGALAKR
jgi:ElaB/YqjD/DUF883 family membrane-anchored ribosome-binding protein